MKLHSLLLLVATNVGCFSESSGPLDYDFLPINNAPVEAEQPAHAWTGRELLIWGGDGWSSTGARYEAASGRWKAMSRDGEPSPRLHAASAWTGTEMIVWGGVGFESDGPTDLADGARYDPVLDRWKPMSKVGAPSGRLLPVTLWTGTELLIAGGSQGGPGLADYCVNLDDGALYNPATDTWRPVRRLSGTSMRCSHEAKAVWTGTEAFFYGDSSQGASWVPDSDQGWTFAPQTQTWTPVPKGGTVGIDSPSTRPPKVIAMHEGKVFIWGGDPSYERGALYSFDGTWELLPPTETVNSRAFLAGDRIVTQYGIIDPFAGSLTPVPDSLPRGWSWEPLEWTGSDAFVWFSDSGSAGAMVSLRD